MPKIILPDQTGFIRNRQASDNVHHLFHIIDSAQMTKEPTLIISMDAEKHLQRHNLVLLSIKSLSMQTTS